MNETEPTVRRAVTEIGTPADAPMVGELPARRVESLLTFQESMLDHAKGTADAVPSKIAKTLGAAAAARAPRDHG